MPFSAQRLTAAPVLEVGVSNAISAQFPDQDFAGVTSAASSGYLVPASFETIGNSLEYYGAVGFQFVPFAEGLNSLLIFTLEISFDGQQPFIIDVISENTITENPLGWYVLTDMQLPKILAAADNNASIIIRPAYRILDGSTPERVYTINYRAVAGFK